MNYNLAFECNLDDACPTRLNANRLYFGARLAREQHPSRIVAHANIVLKNVVQTADACITNGVVGRTNTRGGGAFII
jgi:hypothetical protein